MGDLGDSEDLWGMNLGDSEDFGGRHDTWVVPYFLL